MLYLLLGITFILTFNMGVILGMLIFNKMLSEVE